MTKVTNIDENIFVEQAEYIPLEEFDKWNIEHPEEEIIVKKLSQWGAKLISGPRGCGKTTLMLKTYNMLCYDNKKSMAIYVNFKSSLKLEPLYKKNTNAVFWFNQWMLFKVYQGLHSYIEDTELLEPDSLIFDKKTVNIILNRIEFDKTDLINEDQTITMEILEEEIRSILDLAEKRHCVLLLDDAAHAFSTEQQRDFFDFFRKIKSKYVSPKAAIYPGVTIYSSTFHVGHDAEEIDVWLKPDSSNYNRFMVELLERRLPSEVFAQLTKKKELLDIVCYAAFGIPRALLNMVRSFYREISPEDSTRYEIKFARKDAMDAIEASFKQSMNIYTSLKMKLPTYEKFISTGTNIYTKMIDLIKEYNKGKEPTKQSVTITITKPLPVELSKVLGFFQYGGLLMPRGELSKGEKGVFEQYFIHYGALIDRNAFMGQQSISGSNLYICLKTRNAHAYTRISPMALIGDEIANAFPLSLPPCQRCKEPRLYEHSKFCLNCGAQLKSVSVFESLVSNDISELPLTQNRIKTIKENSAIRTIKDILMDNENKELRKVPQVGPIWARRIFSYAEEYIV